QRTVGEDTATLEKSAPKAWRYLCHHAERLDNRGSSIYAGRPRFSVFGVGDYSFTPWKVAISGLYKQLGFRVIGPLANQPVVFDDAVYFLACETEEDARYLAALLNSPPAQNFLAAIIFWDAKRPITADLLRRLNLLEVAREHGSEDAYRTFSKTRGLS